MTPPPGRRPTLPPSHDLTVADSPDLDDRVHAGGFGRGCASRRLPGAMSQYPDIRRFDGRSGMPRVVSLVGMPPAERLPLAKISRSDTSRSGNSSMPSTLPFRTREVLYENVH